MNFTPTLLVTNSVVWVIGLFCVTRLLIFGVNNKLGSTFGYITMQPAACRKRNCIITRAYTNTIIIVMTLFT